MKIITLWQPWASAIAFQLKQAETRNWPTKYRGQLLIHAAKRIPKAREIEALRGHTGSLFTLDQLCDDYGCVVAVAELTDVKVMDQDLIEAQTPTEIAWGGWASGRYAWEFEHIRALSSPIPWRGQQGIREAPDELKRLVAADMAIGEAIHA